MRPNELRPELVVPRSFPAELVTPVCVERTDRWPWSRSRTRFSRCAWPSGRPSVAAQQPAESFVSYHHITRWLLGGARREHTVAETLVRSFEAIVVSDEFPQGVLQVVGSKQNQPLEALSLDRLHEALGNRIGQRLRRHPLRRLIVDVSGDASVPPLEYARRAPGAARQPEAVSLVAAGRVNGQGLQVEWATDERRRQVDREPAAAQGVGD